MLIVCTAPHWLIVLINRRIPDSSWKPEYGRYMLEGTPGVPYGSTLDDLLTVEDNMRRRYD